MSHSNLWKIEAQKLHRTLKNINTIVSVLDAYILSIEIFDTNGNK